MIQRLALLFKSSECIFSTTQMCNSVWGQEVGPDNFLKMQQGKFEKT